MFLGYTSSDELSAEELQSKKRSRNEFEDESIRQDNDTIREDRKESIKNIVEQHQLSFEQKKLRHNEMVASTLEVLSSTFLSCEDQQGQVDAFKWWFNRNDKFVRDHFVELGVNSEIEQQMILMSLLPEYYARRKKGYYAEIIKQLKREGALGPNWVDFYDCKDNQDT